MSVAGVRCHLPIANVEYPRSRRISGKKPSSADILASRAARERLATGLEGWFLPLSTQERAREQSEVVCAFVWRHRARARALGESLGPVLAEVLDGTALDVSAARHAESVRTAAGGEPPRVLSPRIPVVSVTGTNGKTTTTRLLAHISMAAGHRTAWSSTDGIVVQGEVVEPGDYSGPAGARGVLEAPGVEVGILETAQFVERNAARFALFAVGSPQQEILARRIKERGLASGVGLCVGASLLFSAAATSTNLAFTESVPCPITGACSTIFSDCRQNSTRCPEDVGRLFTPWFSISEKIPRRRCWT